MDAIQAMMTRRSKRALDGEPVTDTHINQILQCGLRAPSSKNAQPWRFHVVADRHTNSAIAQAVRANPESAGSRPINPRTGSGHKKYQSSVLASAAVLESASTAIYIENISPFVGGRKQLLESKAIDTAIHGYEFEYLGLGAAIENMLLAAHALGLGAVFIGDFIIEEDTIKQTVGFTSDFVGVIAIGKSSQAKLWDKHLKPHRIVWH